MKITSFRRILCSILVFNFLSAGAFGQRLLNLVVPKSGTSVITLVNRVLTKQILPKPLVKPTIILDLLNQRNNVALFNAARKPTPLNLAECDNGLLTLRNRLNISNVPVVPSLIQKQRVINRPKIKNTRKR